MNKEMESLKENIKNVQDNQIVIMAVLRNILELYSSTSFEDSLKVSENTESLIEVLDARIKDVKKLLTSDS